MVPGPAAGYGPRRTLVALLRHARQRWYLYLPLMGIWMLAYMRLFYSPVPHTTVLFNWTPSLPYRVAYLAPQIDPPSHGDFILYRFTGEATAQYPGLRGQPFFKQITGLPGEIVTVEDRRVYVSGRFVGLAKPRTFDGYPLSPITPTTIPADHYFVSGTSPDSFDSRYSASGLVCAEQIIGRVKPLF